MSMRPRTAALAIISFVSGCVLFSAAAFSWTGPSAAPPNSNVAAPINVGSTDQIKNANLGINGLAVFGNSLLQASAYLNWGATAGSGGYGVRDNAGTLEFKNSGGSWASIQSTVSSLVGTATWTTVGSDIYSANAGNVGIGTGAPAKKLHVFDATASTGNPTVRLEGVAGGYGAGIEAGSARSGGTYLAMGKMVWDGESTWNTTASTQDSYARIFTTIDGALTERMRITSAGNVGIGTSAPTESLSVAGRVMASGSGYTTGPSGTVLGQYDATTGYVQAPANGRLQIWNGGTTAIAEFANIGYVGIGATPSHRLHVVGPASTGVDAIYGVTGINDAATYGVYGASANGYYGGLGRGDGYSFVGNGSLYNNGTIYGTAFLYLSDKNLKENIKPLDGGLMQIMKLKPVSFTWKKDTPLAGQDDIGLIAQDVEKILPGLVHRDNKGILSIDYVRLTPILVKSVQEQEAKIGSLQSDNAALKVLVCQDHPLANLCTN